MTNRIPKMIVVDDEEEFVDILRSEIKRAHKDWTIDIAYSGVDAFSKVKENDYDVILSDFNMPGMNGISFLIAVREFGLDTPFIFLTGFADQQLLLDALKLGAFDLLDKGIPIEKILETVDQAADYSLGLRQIDEEINHIFESSNLQESENFKNILDAKKKLQILRFQNSRRRQK